MLSDVLADKKLLKQKSDLNNLKVVKHCKSLEFIRMVFSIEKLSY